MKSNVIGWEAYEIIGEGIFNINFGGHTLEECVMLVAEGKAQWILGAGGVLKLEAPDHELGTFESFVKFKVPLRSLLERRKEDHGSGD